MWFLTVATARPNCVNNGFICASLTKDNYLKLLHLFLLAEPDVCWKPEPASSLAQQHPSRVLMSQQWTNELKGTGSLCTSLLLTILKAKRKAQLFSSSFLSPSDFHTVSDLLHMEVDQLILDLNVHSFTLNTWFWWWFCSNMQYAATELLES